MAIINIDRSAGLKTVSVKIKEGKDLVNGMLIGLGKKETVGEIELYAGETPKADSILGIIADPFHPYTASEKEDDMKFNVGDVVRVYMLEASETYSVSKADCVKGALNDGDFVKADGNKWTKASTKAEAIGRVVDPKKILLGSGQESVQIELI